MPPDSVDSRISSKRAPKTRRGLTCANCRSRKTRCDGTLPGCKTCEVYNVTCSYERSPPVSQVLAMAKRLQETEDTVTQLRAALEQTARQKEIHSPQQRGEIEAESTCPGSPHTHGYSDISTDNAITIEDIHSPTHEVDLLSDLSLDEHGKLCYHGPTSAVHAPPPDLAKERGQRSTLENAAVPEASRTLGTTAFEARSWEDFALGNAAIQTGIPGPTIARLLQIHWAWIAPMFNWVYRPAFMRDMVAGGPSYSPFLLIVLCAHAARFDSRELSELLIARARLLLGDEIHRPSSISTAQALLQLSARDLAYGFISQAWLYSGMAFRMVGDLGLHHSTAKVVTLGRLSAEDLEIRRRLFWSCYFWDKAISLYLGRTPVLPDLPLNRSLELVDDSAEHDIWSPHCAGLINLSNIPFGQFPDAKAHLVSSFKNCCKLAVILNDIISLLYSRRGIAITNEGLSNVQNRLDRWRNNSPNQLRYNSDSLPSICPPPHILSQNLLYYTAIILLHRPFNSCAEHHNACRKASGSIEKLILLFGKTFGFTRLTYLMAYCVYTGASATIPDTKAGNSEANGRMLTFLDALKQGTTTCPVFQRSLDIITNSLKPDNNQAPQVKSYTGLLTKEPVLTMEYLPAFPYQGPDVTFDSGSSQQFMATDETSLDCFPEAQYADMDVYGDWFFPAA